MRLRAAVDARGLPRPHPDHRDPMWRAERRVRRDDPRGSAIGLATGIALAVVYPGPGVVARGGVDCRGETDACGSILIVGFRSTRRWLR